VAEDQCLLTGFAVDAQVLGEDRAGRRTLQLWLSLSPKPIEESHEWTSTSGDERSSGLRIPVWWLFLGGRGSGLAGASPSQKRTAHLSVNRSSPPLPGLPSGARECGTLVPRLQPACNGLCLRPLLAPVLPLASLRRLCRGGRLAGRLLAGPAPAGGLACGRLLEELVAGDIDRLARRHDG